MRRLALVLGLLLVPFLWLGAEPAAACSCAPRSVGELVDSADVVVLGRVKEREVVRGGMELVYTFFGSERFKGDLTPGFEVHTSSSGASCGLEGLVVGRRYVVFLDEREDLLTANLCGGTRQASTRYVAAVEAVAGPGFSFDLPPPAPPAPSGAPKGSVEALRAILTGTTLWG